VISAVFLLTWTGACNPLIIEEFEDTRRVIRICISKKNKQHNDQKKKYNYRELFWPGNWETRGVEI
jgi:hypothetical protein